MDADDDDEAVWGRPPPDPAMRTWRHPSEIGAGADLREVLPTPPERGNRRLLAGTTVAAVVAIGTVAFLPLLGPDSSTETDIVTAAGGLETGDTLISPDANPDDNDTAINTATDGRSAGDAAGNGATSLDGVLTGSSNNSTTDQGGTTLPDAHADGATTLTTVVVNQAPTSSDKSLGILALRSGSSASVVATAINLGDGQLITSASAIAGRDKLTAGCGGTHWPLTVVAADPYTDIALLSADEADGELPDPLEPSPHPLSEGDAFRMIGVTEDGTLGVVDGRIVQGGQHGTARSGGLIIDTFMTDAAASTAGAVLLDAQGHILGMAVDSTSHLADAIGYATLQAVTHSLATIGWGDPTWFGISGTIQADGLYIDEVTLDSPGDLAGLSPGDVVTTINDVVVTSLAEVVSAVRRTGPGGELTVLVQGRTEPFTVTLGHRPGPKAPSPADSADAASATELDN